MPDTEAGRRLLEAWGLRSIEAHRAVAAIEAEARNQWAGVSLEQGRIEGRTAALDALAAKVEGLVMGGGTVTFDAEGATYFGDVWAYRAAVLALIAEARR